jgi:hypothetical protein
MKAIHLTRSGYFSALFEIGLMFLPAIPAYLWVWPNLEGAQLDIFQIIVPIYMWKVYPLFKRRS